jgi:integrase
MSTHRQRTDYLWFRPNTSLIWFSRAVPKEYVEAEGRKQIQFSLKIADRKEAAAMARCIASEQDARWGLLQPRQPHPTTRKIPSVEELEEAAVLAAYEFEVTAADEGRRNLRGKGPIMWQGHRNWVRADLDEQARMTATHDYSNVETIAQQVIEATGFEIAPGDAAYERLCDLLNKQLLNAMKVNVERTDGNIDFETHDPVVRRVRERNAAKAKPGETILELFERWAAERLAKKQKRLDTVNQDRKKIEQFAAFVGVDRAVDSITAEEVFEYRETLRNLPPKWAANKALKGLPIREAAKRSRELGLPNTAFTTVNLHLSTISPLYKWLAGQPAWVGLANPCNGLFHDGVKGKNPRPPLSTAALNKILSSPLFTGFLADDHENKPGNVHADDWRRWILLATMFTGARLGEIAQLRICDVREDRGVWLVQISEEEKDGLTTKNRKGHLVPVHSKLIALGFLAFVERQRAERANDAPLFTGIERNSRGHFGKVAHWYRDYFEAIGVKNGKDGIGAHSFRHTLTDRLRGEAELLDGQIAVILDHSTKTTTGGYGALPQGTVTMLKGWIESVRFDGVDFSHLISAAEEATGG